MRNKVARLLCLTFSIDDEEKSFISKKNKADSSQLKKSIKGMPVGQAGSQTD